MGKLLQINPVIREDTSTGRIMREIAESAMADGWESYIAYGKGRDGIRPSGSHIVPVGSRFDSALHLLATRLFDRHGLASRRATRRFVREVARIDPDVIHIHNIHGYFLHYKILFDYLARSGKPVIWTVHDCWLFTGHCYHYAAAGCDRWQTQCHHCPQRNSFPRSWLLDRSRKNFRDKKKAFTSLPDITFVTVSQWMRDEMARSFLGKCRFKVIHNGIDLELFRPGTGTALPLPEEVRGKAVILGVASIWLKEKGFDDFIRLSGLLHADERLVLVGRMDESQKRSLPPGIITLPRTGNVQQLAALYTRAAVFVNPTWQDNYPTVNMEAQACGTPVVTYRTGGSIETLSPETGAVVEQGDVEGLRLAIDRMRSRDRAELRQKCRFYASTHFKKEDLYKEYLSLYRLSSGR